MTISSSSIKDAYEPFVPRLPVMIGRTEQISEISDAIKDKDNSYVLYVVGLGGMGKTRLLEEIGVLHKQGQISFRWSGIIDLYHSIYHSPEGLRHAIAEKLDPRREFFQEYYQVAEEYEKKQRENVSPADLEKIRRKIGRVFRWEYEDLAKKHRIVLCFDTIEVIQHESDEVQEICQIEENDTVVKNWLQEEVGKLPNTVILFAGRPVEKVEADFERSFESAGRQFKVLRVEALPEQETKAYLDFMRAENPTLEEILTPDVERQIYHLTQGRPIRLALLLELLLHGEALTNLFPSSSEETQHDTTIAAVDKTLLEHIKALPDPLGQIIHYMIYARKGLDVALLRYLVGDSWTEDAIQAALHRLREFAFVKYRPESTQLFLHDEVYDLADRLDQKSARGAQEFSHMAAYYHERLASASSTSEREASMLALLYYELQIDAQQAYQQYYTRWAETAIENHETEFDMQLRGEVLRFLNRYTAPESEFYNPRVALRVDRAAIDRDSAVRWVKRYYARGQHNKAIEIAENIRYSTHPAFAWEVVNDPIYKAGLLTAWGKAATVIGSSSENSHQLFEDAIDLLEGLNALTPYHAWWRSVILGKAHDGLGYLLRTRGRYTLALEHYKRALPYFEAADVQDALATTLNNLAFLLAQLGRPKQAHYHVELALNIRNKRGYKYPLALSKNTLGIIFTHLDRPRVGARYCREALRICEDLEEQRGIGLASNALGFTLRRFGELWKQEIVSIEEAQQYYEEAEQHLKKAVNIFSRHIAEPIRLWEAYNELGSLYREKGVILLEAQPDTFLDRITMIAQEYARSIEHEEQGLAIAIEHDLEFQKADSTEDLAQIYGERSFFLSSIGQEEEAKRDRQQAETHLAQVEQMVPDAYWLVPGKGFREAPKGGETYWVALGKSYRWRGTWLLRDLEMGRIPAEAQEQVLQEATRHLLTSIIYLRQYWHLSPTYTNVLHALGSALQRARVSFDWANQQADTLSSEYNVNLAPVMVGISDFIGL